MIKFLVEPGFEVKSPSREPGNAGIDFYIPKYNEVFKKAFEEKNDPHKAAIVKSNEIYYIVIAPHGDANIPSGIHSFFDEDTGLIQVNKSGIAAKKKLVTGACLIDASYQGIIHCHVLNTSAEQQMLELDTKVVQFVPYKFDTSTIEVIRESTKEEFYKDLKFTNRKDGGFGSTGIV